MLADKTVDEQVWSRSGFRPAINLCVWSWPSMGHDSLHVRVNCFEKHRQTCDSKGMIAGCTYTVKWNLKEVQWSLQQEHSVKFSFPSPPRKWKWKYPVTTICDIDSALTSDAYPHVGLLIQLHIPKERKVSFWGWVSVINSETTKESPTARNIFCWNDKHFTDLYSSNTGIIQGITEKGFPAQ